jgi:hypothetical protein
MKNLLYSRDRAAKGAALMIVLAFVVLLTGLALAYFSRTTTDRQLAQSSYNDTSTDLLARSALDIVVSDFKQEILSHPTVTPNPPYYITPVPYGTPASGDIANLIRRSFSGDPTNRTSSVSSGALSANGRSINTTRWNSHYLLPRGNPGDTNINPSPTPSFIAPDWVLVTAQGPAQVPAPAAVVGRYAFAVYDEGALLDMSLAGFPSWTNNPSGGCAPAPTPWANNIGYKGNVGFADLTALGTYAPPQTQIDNIVGWRNYATTLRTGATFGSFNYAGENSCTIQDSYGSYLLDYGDPPFTFDINDQPVPISSYPFSAVYPAVNSSRTDQAFMTRQQLLKLRNSLGFSQNVLQYMGTFSRERNKPAPDWPFLQNNLTEGRYCFDNLDLVKPNPDGCTNHGRHKGQGKGKGRGHLCGTQADIVNLFGLLWIKSSTLPPDPNGNPQPGHWKYIAHNGPNHDPNPNAIDHIPPFRGPNHQNDFFQILDYALFRVDYGINGDADPNHLSKTFAIGASLIDQYDDSTSTDDLDTTVVKKWQSHTTVIEYTHNGGPVFAYGMETQDVDYTSNANQPHRPYGAPTPGPNTYVMDHAFTNVGQFGYGIVTNVAGVPTLDFSTSGSSDAPALDFFGYNPVSSSYPRGGIVNLNTKNAPVLAAIMKGAAPTDGASTFVNQTQATNAAQAIVTETTARPALTRGDVARLVSVAGAQIGASQEQKQTVARALAEVGQTRTWNLFVDVIAQTGRYAPDATNVSQANKFTVEGEKRYWLHVALGRDLNSDGSVDVLGTQLEEVVE